MFYYSQNFEVHLPSYVLWSWLLHGGWAHILKTFSFKRLVLSGWRKKLVLTNLRVCQKKKPSEASQAILWSLSAQKPPYWSSTLLPPFPDAKYQLLKLRHAQRAKFLEVFWVNSDTAVLTLTFHRFCFTKHFRESFRRCRCQSTGTRSSMEFSGQLFMVFWGFSLVSLTESC